MDFIITDPNFYETNQELNDELIRKDEVYKEIIRFDLSSFYFQRTYLKRFYQMVSKSVKANLQREYYDYIIAEFDNQYNLNDLQYNCINKWKKYFFIEQQSINESKIILKKINEYLTNQKRSDYIPENALFELVFLLEKKRQHIEYFNQMILKYKSKNTEKYEYGLVVLRELEKEYSLRIKEAEKNIKIKE